MESLQESVLNEQANKMSAESLLPYYSHFLAETCPVEIIQAKILPRLTFVLNRNREFLSVVAETVRLISEGNKFKINEENLKAWIDGLMPDELLMQQMENPTRLDVWKLVMAVNSMLYEESKNV